MNKIDPSEITPKRLYLSRRQFITGTGAVAIGAAVLAACRGGLPGVPTATTGIRAVGTAVPGTAIGTAASGTAPSTPSESMPSGYTGPTSDELGDPLNTYQDITNYNNYYEFTTNKEAVAKLAADFPASPWSVNVSGLVSNPKTYSIADLQKFKPEDRVYRLRCVEAWSLVIPWVGFPLNRLLDDVQPTSDATYVQFTTLFDPRVMPGQNSTFLNWPYVEGLRMDEAMHDLTILATGLYGEPLPNQDGAPVRLVVPWKYGFKSIKAIVKIELVNYQPVSLWMQAAPNEYGFYANVNPNVNHPRWSQATERRIGEVGRRKTLMFNGYEDQVASLYAGMDLNKNF